jgi:hypothetical protein
MEIASIGDDVTQYAWEENRVYCGNLEVIGID